MSSAQQKHYRQTIHTLTVTHESLSKSVIYVEEEIQKPTASVYRHGQERLERDVDCNTRVRIVKMRSELMSTAPSADVQWVKN